MSRSLTVNTFAPRPAQLLSFSLPAWPVQLLHSPPSAHSCFSFPSSLNWLSLCSITFLHVATVRILKIPQVACSLVPLSHCIWGFLSGSVVKNPPAMQETQVWSLRPEDPLEKEMATHSSMLAWEISWTEELAGYSQLLQPFRVAKNQTQLSMRHWICCFFCFFFSVSSLDTAHSFF